MNLTPIPQDFYLQNTKTVAKKLLGALLVRQINKSKSLICQIVETEAYLGIKDPACHSFRNRRTQRTEAMYLPGGHSYVYFIYGMYHCFNVVTGPEHIPEAVLIRAVAPLWVVCDNQLSKWTPENQPKRKLPTNGPGKLCRFLKIDRSHNQLPLWNPCHEIWLAQPLQTLKRFSIGVTSRVGISYAGSAKNWPLRFYLRGSPFVSKHP